MKITLKKLRLTNFKGVQNQEIHFSHITNIYGDNATGKTTIFDAFLWLFFGKNSEDKSDFEVKRLDQSNSFIKNLESEVEATILVDSQEIVAKKVLRQKWVKRRGEMETNYNGDENIYYWNDVPLKESEFRVKVKGLVDELLFKLITNPFYFNSIKWQERRNILVEIAGNITNTEILDSVITVSNKGRFNDLINALNNGKTIDEFKRELAAKKKKIKDEAESIPSRIDEVRRSIPQVLVNNVAGQIESVKQQLQEIEVQLHDKQAAAHKQHEERMLAIKKHNQTVQEHQQEIFDLRVKIREHQYFAEQQAKQQSGKISAQIKSISSEVANKKLEIEQYENGIKALQEKKVQLERQLDELRELYVKADEEQLVFNEHEFVCPSCSQSLPQDNIEAKKEELTNNFNRNKIERLESIKSDAEKRKAEIANISTRISNGEASLSVANEALNGLNNQLEELQAQSIHNDVPVETLIQNILGADQTYQALVTELANKEAIVIEAPVFPDSTDETVNTELKARKDTLMAELSSLTKEQAKEDQINEANRRILELSDQETNLANELNALESSEFAIQEFTKAKVDAIEKRINSKFQYVTFKMFEQQVNGGETETCQTLVNSNGSFVPFSDANNAAKINAGIDIINTLCKHYDVYAPVFIDNRESVTRLADSESQIVNLIVSAQDKFLRVA